MDPLSVVTSIAGLLKAAAAVSSIASKISASKTSGFKEIRNVKTTVETIRSVLLQLQFLLLRSATINHERASMILVNEVVVTLTGCVMTFSDLDGCIKGLESDEKLRLLDSVRWTSSVPELKGYLQKLEAHKSSLTLMLRILTCQPSQNAENAASELNLLMRHVLDSNEDLARRMRLLENPDATSAVSSEGDSTSVGNDTIRGPSTLVDISDASGSASQHIRIVYTFEQDLQSTWVYQRFWTRVQTLPITIEDLGNGDLYNIAEEDEVRSEHTTNVQIQSRQPDNEPARLYKSIGPYKFTHKELVKRGVIQKSSVPESEFIVRLYYRVVVVVSLGGDFRPFWSESRRVREALALA
ncbi:hypothetical protein G7Y89_g11553 [Cudoniella acicularis]|uniref:Fungal N-terminal domain-containing protein n=1 Tax=Cudoniella acicularis TaxID=354080 RepID=A0A8H4RD06_9HELO|nr:hypothetical protein G7Y89_g11553 [Cudoniella acicularis]